jgi:hypothetical protein
LKVEQLEDFSQAQRCDGYASSQVTPPRGHLGECRQTTRRGAGRSALATTIRATAIRPRRCR